MVMASCLDQRDNTMNIKGIGINFPSLKKIVATFKSSSSSGVDYPYSPYEHQQNLNVFSFGGEKTPYELGPAVDTYPDYYQLRIRSWDAFLKSDVVQTAIKKYCLWIVGAGLKLQSEPIKKVLELYGVNVSEKQLKEFSSSTESLFRLFCEMNKSVYSQEYNIHEEAAETTKNAILAGDVLCLKRFDGKYCTIETIDGRHVQTPELTTFEAEAEERGNTIIQGVEIDKKKSHVAYYISGEDIGDYQRIPAYSIKTGTRQAWLFYGQKFRKSDVRGMSLLTAVLEVLSKMDRYKEATVGSAEENAKIPYTIEHDHTSDGTNPMIDAIKESYGKGRPVAPETESDCEAKARNIAETTQKQTFNMPVGAKFKRHAGSTDINFGEFFNVNLDIVYSALGIPPEVANDKFGGAYSGSRAALKSWEHKIMVDRIKLLKRQFYKPFYDYWLDAEILTGRIKAPGYINAIANEDDMVIEAYRNCRFIGPLVPHIDPLKEVNAARKKLGTKFDAVPLTTVEQTVEELSTGDVETNKNKLENEAELFKEFIDNANSIVV